MKSGSYENEGPLPQGSFFDLSIPASVGSPLLTTQYNFEIFYGTGSTPESLRASMESLGVRTYVVSTASSGPPMSFAVGYKFDD